MYAALKSNTGCIKAGLTVGEVDGRRLQQQLGVNRARQINAAHPRAPNVMESRDASA
jgi:hypothetical protein